MYHVTKNYSQLHLIEGLQNEDVGRGWAILIVTFMLNALYLPISTMAVHAVIWSQDLWVVPNPYMNATIPPSDLPPLGPPEQYRAPLDFCWTTTMKRNEINFAPVMVIAALIILASVSDRTSFSQKYINERPT
jgi:hypothetical protein